MGFLALAVLTVLVSSASGQAEDVVWYIDPTSTEDPQACGHDPSRPCASLEVVFERSRLVNASSSCYTGPGDQDGRSSTTVFLTGSVFVPAVCLFNWQNLRVSSYPPGQCS
jgi:hypothetical protein